MSKVGVIMGSDSDLPIMKEAIEILNMGEIIETFYLNKLMEFRLYWIERGQQRDN